MLMNVSWRETISLDDLWEGDMTEVVVDSEPVLLVNVDGVVRAYANRCPHQASPLDEGDLDGTTLTCARHLWEFDVSTGLGINPAGVPLRGFGCQVGEDGIIYVDIGRLCARDRRAVMTFPVELRVTEPRLRITETDASMALHVIEGIPVVPGPGQAPLRARSHVRAARATARSRDRPRGRRGARPGAAACRGRCRAGGGQHRPGAAPGARDGGLDTQPDLPRADRPAARGTRRGKRADNGNDLDARFHCAT